MQNSFQRTRVLITVMTYPHPSKNHREVVCTAGITDNYEWVRLYPIDYRYRPTEQQFKKYQYIEIDLEPYGNGNDGRKESRKPKLDTIEILGEPLTTQNKWRERNKIIDNVHHYTLNELKALYEKDKTSLGVVRPTYIHDIVIEEADKEWKPEWQEELNQFRLFGEETKRLTKIPFKFSYIFDCKDNLKSHKIMITDWELGVLYLNQFEKYGSEETAANKVKEKYLNQLCSKQNDTRFFMGTSFPFNTWLVLGVYWPPKENQTYLFD